MARRKLKWPAKSREARGYGTRHRRMRVIVTGAVEAGEAFCVRCGGWIPPGSEWDLGHNDERTGWTGPEHSRCNRSAGGRNGPAVTNGRRRPGEKKYVRSWSRVWEWRNPRDIYVDPEVVREYVEEEASRLI